MIGYSSWPKKEVEFAQAVYCKPLDRVSTVDLSKLPSSLNYPLEFHDSIGVGPFAAAEFESNVALESAKAIESMIDSVVETEVEYIGPKSPSEWAKIFKVSWITIRRRIDARKIRAIQINSKSWKIVSEDVAKVSHNLTTS